MMVLGSNGGLPSITVMNLEDWRTDWSGHIHIGCNKTFMKAVIFGVAIVSAINSQKWVRYPLNYPKDIGLTVFPNLVLFSGLLYLQDTSIR